MWHLRVSVECYPLSLHSSCVYWSLCKRFVWLLSEHSPSACQQTADFNPPLTSPLDPWLFPNTNIVKNRLAFLVTIFNKGKRAENTSFGIYWILIRTKGVILKPRTPLSLGCLPNQFSHIQLFQSIPGSILCCRAEKSIEIKKRSLFAKLLSYKQCSLGKLCSVATKVRN